MLGWGRAVANNLEALKADCAKSSSAISELRGRRDSLLERLNVVDRISKDKEEAVVRIGSAIALTQRFYDSIQADVVHRFEDLLTQGVRQIFGKNYTVHIEFTSNKANTIQADFFITLPDGKKVNLAKGEGGGLRDLVAVLQRVLYIVLEPTHPAKIIFMDESLKHLDRDRAAVAFPFIIGVLKELGIQAVWISHSDSIKTIDGTPGVSIIRVGGDGA